MELDIGTLPSYSEEVDATPDDPTRPARILARVVARGFDRVAPLRKLSRHFEGTEQRAGIGSDLFAEAVELYGRNENQFDKLASEYLKAVQHARSERRAKAEQAKAQTQAPHDGAEIPIRRVQ